MLAFVLIIHEVDDYAAWKIIFDKAATLRREAGEMSFQVLKDWQDPNRIVHFSHWQSLEAARAFFESDRVAEIRRQAGVQAPQFVYLDQLESGDLTAGLNS